MAKKAVENFENLGTVINRTGNLRKVVSAYEACMRLLNDEA